MWLYKSHEDLYGIPIDKAYLRITSYEVQPVKPDNTYDVRLLVNYFPTKENPNSYKQLDYTVNVANEDDIYLDKFYDMLLTIIPDTTKDTQPDVEK